MAIDAGKVVATLELETKAFSGGVNTAKGLIQSLGSDSMTGAEKMRALSNAAGALGKTLTTAVTLPLAAMGTAAVATFTSFDDAMRQVRATMGLYDETSAQTAEDIDALTEAAKEMGRTTRYSASEAASALNYLALAGYNADQAIEALPTVLRLAQAGGLDLAYASDLVTDSMSALGLEMGQLTTFADQLAVTSQKSNTNVSQLGQAILTVGATAANLAGGTTELNAELGILADSGIKGAEGGTHLRNVILALTQPTEAGAQAIAKYTQGVYDAEGNIRSLDAILGELKESMSSMTQAERNSVINDIFNKTDLAAAQVLIAGAGERFAELTGYIQNSTGAAEGMADVMEGGLGGSMRSLKSATEGMMIAIGEELAPMVQGAAGFVNDLVNGFNSLDDSTRSTIVTIGTIAAAVGPALLVISKLTAGLMAINPVVAGVTLGVAGLAAVAYKLSNIPSWSDTVDGQLGINVDESELENYKINTDEIDAGTVTANVEVEIRNKAKSAREQILDILSDGKPEGQDEYDDMCASVYSIIDGVESSVKTYWDNKRSTLQGLFDAGLIDKDSMDAQMAEYDAKQAEMEAGLTTNAQAVTDYIATLVAANRAPTEAEIAQLQTLIDKLAEVGVAAAEATNAVEEGYRMAYERARSGQALDGDTEKASTYIEMVTGRRRNAVTAQGDAAEANYAQDLDMYTARMAAATEAMNNATVGSIAWTQAQDDYDAASKAYAQTLTNSAETQAKVEAALGEVDAERDAMYREMATSAAQGVGDSETLQQALQEWLRLRGDLDKLNRDYGATDEYSPYHEGLTWHGWDYGPEGKALEAARDALQKQQQLIAGMGLDGFTEAMGYWSANGESGYDITTTRGMIQALADLTGATDAYKQSLIPVEAAEEAAAESAAAGAEALTETEQARLAAAKAADEQGESLYEGQADNEAALEAAREAEEAAAAAQAQADTIQTTLLGIPVEVDAVTGEVVTLAGQAVDEVGSVLAVLTSDINGVPVKIRAASAYAAAGSTNGDAYVAAWNAAMTGLYFPQPVYYNGGVYYGENYYGPGGKGDTNSDNRTYNNQIYVNAPSGSIRDLQNNLSRYGQAQDRGKGAVYITPD